MATQRTTCPETGAVLTTRISPRHEIALKATIGLEAGGKFGVDLQDISMHGFKAACSLPIGSMAELWLPDLETRAAKIVWSLGGRSGGRFEEPLSYSSTILRFALEDGAKSGS
jgi:hypothetical protein